jgi:hypothetical protein
MKQVEAAWSSEMLVNFQWTAQRDVPEEILYNRLLEPLHFLMHEE